MPLDTSQMLCKHLIVSKNSNRQPFLIILLPWLNTSQTRFTTAALSVLYCRSISLLIPQYEVDLFDRALKMHFANLESDESRGINTTRGLACEYVAWRFLTHLSGRELIYFLLYELPPCVGGKDDEYDEDTGHTTRQRPSGPSRQNTNGTQASLLSSSQLESAEGIEEETQGDADNSTQFDRQDDDFASSFDSLNALEIAAVSDAKKFMSQRIVQRTVESIWRGDIIFWETLSVNSVKEAKVYNKRYG